MVSRAPSSARFTVTLARAAGRDGVSRSRSSGGRPETKFPAASKADSRWMANPQEPWKQIAGEGTHPEIVKLITHTVKLKSRFPSEHYYTEIAIIVKKKAIFFERFIEIDDKAKRELCKKYNLCVQEKAEQAKLTLKKRKKCGKNMVKGVCSGLDS